MARARDERNRTQSNDEKQNTDLPRRAARPVRVPACPRARGQETLPLNQHKLQPPFHKAAVRGDILLMRVAEDGAPLDFKAAE